MISWMSRKKKIVALCIVEVNYMSSSMDSYEETWLRKLFGELFDLFLETTVIYCDNKSGIYLAWNPIFHGNSKHIEIQLNFIQDMV